MNIVRLGRSTELADYVSYSPFMYISMPGAYTLADYWTSTFGTGEADDNKRILVTKFARGSTTLYSEVASVALCTSTEQSWYWDFTNQILYVHFEHDQNPFTDVYTYNYAEGYCDSTSVIYIDDIEYLPLVNSIPSLAQSSSIVGYNKQTYISGTIDLSNASRFGKESGPLDYLITEKLYGNAVELLYLDEDDLTFDGKVYSAIEADLTATAFLYVESFQFTPTGVSLGIQDPRKSENIPIPTDLYNVTDYPDINKKYYNKVIPIAYGLISEILCTPVNGDAGGAVTFKAAESLTDFGTAYVEIDDVWTVATVASSVLSTGQFVLADATARDAKDKIYPCKVVDAIGEVVTYASDVIKALNLKYLSVPYNTSFYDTTEWEAEETDLSTIGILIDSIKPLSDWTYSIQGGANIGFRYEYKPDGLRTIKVRDNDRTSGIFIPNAIIVNIDELPVETDPTETVFAKVNVNYAKSYESGIYSTAQNQAYYDNVVYNYKTYDELSLDTYLTTSTNAGSRALTDALDYSDVRPNAEVIVYGADQLEHKIFDVVTVELTSGFADYDNKTVAGREYFGAWTALVLGVNPNGKNKTNTLQLRLLESIDLTVIPTPVKPVIIVETFTFEDGVVFTFEDGKEYTLYNVGA